jgi:RNA recognition motif-containing protein
MKLIILNLPRDFTEKELAILFKSHGDIKKCTLVMDSKTKKSKGFGFVEMALEHKAVSAIEKLNNSLIGTKKIRVKSAD